MGILPDIIGIRRREGEGAAALEFHAEIGKRIMNKRPGMRNSKAKKISDVNMEKQSTREYPIIHVFLFSTNFSPFDPNIGLGFMRAITCWEKGGQEQREDVVYL